MAESDWTECTGGLGVASVDRGVTAGAVKPNGGGNFVFGFHSLIVADGAVAYFTNQPGFAPTPPLRGGSIRGAIKRGISGGATGFAPMLFIGLQGPDVSDAGYLLGLSDADPATITLRKGSLLTGLPDAGVGTNGILRKSATTFAIDTWVHLRLDMVVNLNGDVVLRCSQNDLGVNPVTAPSWVAISGMTDFIDDALAVNTGSQPFTSGRLGFGYRTKDVNRLVYVDHIESLRQV